MREHRPRKRFGQNFLHDPAVIARIVAAIDPRADDLMVEIGPGQGAITWPLLRRLGHLHAVELDRDLCRDFQQQGDTGLSLHNIDALKFDFCALRADRRMLRVVGNLPYNISSPLIFHLLHQICCIHDMHFLLQRELVERICAEPGGKVYGRLSVMVQAQCHSEHLFNVGAGAFRPAPRVQSALLRLTPRAQPLVPEQLRAAFARVVERAFSQRRKTLRKSLGAMLDARSLAACGVDPGDRPERLDIAAFLAISRALQQNDMTPAEQQTREVVDE
jgi:16S rRNA (adenine1518-N6/adenine1519-N6)-dimethyltransferase